MCCIHPCTHQRQDRARRDAWLHEPKLDGYWLQVIKEGRKVRLFSCREHE